MYSTHRETEKDFKYALLLYSCYTVCVVLQWKPLAFKVPAVMDLNIYLQHGLDGSDDCFVAFV